MKQVPGYQRLKHILDAAYEQAAYGKGKERHANDLPFHAQPIMQITTAVGSGFPIGQAMKKTQEASGMLKRRELPAARHELLGAIVYLSAAIIQIESELK